MSTRHEEAAARAWELLQDLADAHSRHGELAEALGFRLGAGRGKVLLRLRDEAMSLTDLAAATGVDAPYATLIVDRLQAHGLVSREPHPHDRRRRLVSLTPAGREAIATADAIRQRPPRAVGSLGAADLRELTRLLELVVAADASGR